MKNRIVYFLFLLAGTFSAKSQTWMPVGGGITGTNINTTWSLCAYDSVLYAGGWFNNAGGESVNNMAQWNNIRWDSTGSGTNGFINAMTVYNGHLYVGGQFTRIGGVAADDIAMWTGSAWAPVGKGLRGGDYGVYALAAYNGQLYAGGSFDTAGGQPVYAIAKWNDTNWSGVGTGVIALDEDDAVFALTVYKGILYIGGDFGLGTSNNIAQWNGTALSDVEGGTVGGVYSFAVYDNLLYVGGMMTLAGPAQVNSIAIWNNSTWLFPDSGITGENGWASINAMAVYQNELYVGGFFDTVNGAPINCIAKWNGANWSPVGSGINPGGAIDAMQVFNNTLYIGGGFDSVGGVYAKNIAMLTSPTSVNKIHQENKLTLYPIPANTILSIEMSHWDNLMNYVIYNELGEKMATGKLATLKPTIIDVNLYPHGTYLVTVADGNKQYSSSFIKN